MEWFTVEFQPKRLGQAQWADRRGWPRQRPGLARHLAMGGDEARDLRGCARTGWRTVHEFRAYDADGVQLGEQAWEARRCTELCGDRRAIVLWLSVSVKALTVD